jgi:hypothetical protein
VSMILRSPHLKASTGLLGQRWGVKQNLGEPGAWCLYCVLNGILRLIPFSQMLFPG